MKHYKRKSKAMRKKTNAKRKTKARKTSKGSGRPKTTARRSLKRLRKYASILTGLNSIKSSKVQLKKAIKDQKLHKNKEFIGCISNCCSNVLRGNLNITNPEQLKKLRSVKSQLRLVAKKSTPLRKKSAIILQSGGFFPALLGAVIPLVSGLIGSLVK